MVKVIDITLDIENVVYMLKANENLEAFVYLYHLDKDLHLIDLALVPPLTFKLETIVLMADDQISEMLLGHLGMRYGKKVSGYKYNPKEISEAKIIQQVCLEKHNNKKYLIVSDANAFYKPAILRETLSKISEIQNGIIIANRYVERSGPILDMEDDTHLEKILRKQKIRKELPLLYVLNTKNVSELELNGDEDIIFIINKLREKGVEVHVIDLPGTFMDIRTYEKDFRPAREYYERYLKYSSAEFPIEVIYKSSNSNSI